MNKQIEKLVIESGMSKILDEHASEYGNGTIENTPYPELEKFAELIINECVHLFVTDKDEEYDEILESINEHFGVK